MRAHPFAVRVHTPQNFDTAKYVRVLATYFALNMKITRNYKRMCVLCVCGVYWTFHTAFGANQPATDVTHIFRLFNAPALLCIECSCVFLNGRQIKQRLQERRTTRKRYVTRLHGQAQSNRRPTAKASKLVVIVCCVWCAGWHSGRLSGMWFGRRCGIVRSATNSVANYSVCSYYVQRRRWWCDVGVLWV